MRPPDGVDPEDLPARWMTAEVVHESIPPERYVRRRLGGRADHDVQDLPLHTERAPGMATDRRADWAKIASQAARGPSDMTPRSARDLDCILLRHIES
jgi:hypothetical protein